MVSWTNDASLTSWRQPFWLTKWLPPWRKGRIICQRFKSVFDCLTIGIIHETMVVHMTWDWTFFNNYSNHSRMCVLSTLCGNVDKHSPFDIYIYIFQTQKLTWCPHPICTIFGGCIKCMQVFIFCVKYIDFCINPFCTGVLNALSVIFFKSSLSIIVNFLLKFVDSSEIF